MKNDMESYSGCVHTEEECRILIHSAMAGIIKIVKSRPTDAEKKKIKPGEIFVYCEEESGIRRWTDKKTWTPSRVQGIFLVYKDLRGPFIKKTYSADLETGKYHIVMYALASWEEDGYCCTLFKNALQNLAISLQSYPQALPWKKHWFHSKDDLEPFYEPCKQDLMGLESRNGFTNFEECRRTRWCPPERLFCEEWGARGDPGRVIAVSQNTLQNVSDFDIYLTNILEDCEGGKSKNELVNKSVGDSR